MSQPKTPPVIGRHFANREEAQRAGIENPQLVWCRPSGGRYCFRKWSASPVRKKECDRD